MIDCLLDQGHDVVCLDNLLTGSKRNIEHVLDKITLQDIIDPFPEMGFFDEIYKSCPASPIHYQSDPMHTLKTI